ncbi:MAG: hypothetical protein PHW13_13005 [Methylococcales bacterium]|nr:hypothetical protein [Methylococcales bacterium]
MTTCHYKPSVPGRIRLPCLFQEIAVRTEQFWCPIKHARHLKTLHSRYQKFIDYGDAEKFNADLESIRRDFKDL